MFLTKRFYIALTITILAVAMGYVFPVMFVIGKALVFTLLAAVLTELAMLYYKWQGIDAARTCSQRFSNGDDNEVSVRLTSRYPFRVNMQVIDEIPPIFQRRDVSYSATLPTATGMPSTVISYTLRPVRRGVYGFGHVLVFVSTRIGLVQRRYVLDEPVDVMVFPSYLMLNKYELLAMSDKLRDLGIKKIRRAGNNTEYEQIKEYVQGDEYRTINWKATARRHQLMVNIYRDERSQQVYNVIDKGRVMQHSFNGMTLLDYAINASLVLSYVTMKREDKAGLITFANRLDTHVAASRQPGQMQMILQSLYSQETVFGETDYSALCVQLGKHVTKRSLMVLYTNFSGLIEMERQLPFLKLLNSRHRLLVVFFEDRELNDYVDTPTKTTEDYYRHVIAEKFVYEKRMIVSRLKQHGILSLLTTPEKLSIDVINKYLELKQRQTVV